MARKSITIVATLHGATRYGTSRDGNPTWTLHTSEGDLRTQSDGQIGYDVTNHTGGPDSWVGEAVEFTATPARRVWDWKVLRHAPEHSDRARWVTDQVALWAENDGDIVDRAKTEAENGAHYLRRYLVPLMQTAAPYSAPWQVACELSATDYGRIHWDDIAARLRD